MSTRLRIFFDGGCRPNPGMMETAVVCRGVVHHRHDLGTGDNDIAEWTALLQALELAIDMGAQDVELVGDSTLVVEQAAGRQACRSERLRPFLRQFTERSAMIPQLRVRQVRRGKNLAGIALDACGFRGPQG